MGWRLVQAWPYQEPDSVYAITVDLHKNHLRRGWLISSAKVLRCLLESILPAKPRKEFKLAIYVGTCVLLKTESHRINTE